MRRKDATKALFPAAAGSDAQLAAACDDVLASSVEEDDRRQSLLSLVELHPASSLPLRTLLMARLFEAQAVAASAESSLPGSPLYDFVKEGEEAVTKHPLCLHTRFLVLRLRMIALQSDVLTFREASGSKAEAEVEVQRGLLRTHLTAAVLAAGRVANVSEMLPLEPTARLPVLRQETTSWFGDAQEPQFAAVYALLARRDELLLQSWGYATQKELSRPQVLQEKVRFLFLKAHKSC